MTKDELMALALDATNDAELTAREIPTIDLYVDQIINLISKKLSEGSERYRSRVLTKTMINNYSKDGIITPVTGKKYTREQLIQILYIYSLKNTLSISEVKRLLCAANEIEAAHPNTLCKLYDKHQDIKNELRERSLEFLDNEIVEELQLDAENDADYISVICALVSMSAHLKNIAQAMIDVKFPEPIDDEEKKKEEKKEEKEKEKKDKQKDKDKKKNK